MRPTDSLESSSSTSPSSRRFSILSRRRDQVHSMDAAGPELEAFQRHVGERFQELSAVDPGELLSIRWIRKLLDTFLSCQDQFLSIVLNNPAQLKKSPMDKPISELFDRGLKALDVCNAIRDGIEQIRQWTKSLEIVLLALHNPNPQKSISEGKIRRAKKALVDLTLAMLDEKESNPRVVAQRNRSFGRPRNTQKSLVNFRSLSWSVSRSWSAAKQLQAISSNLTAPRPNETASTNGLNVAVFTMSYVLLFVMWALVAAIPCQDRGLQTNFYMGRQFVWAGPILLLHERILEESKRRDMKNARGLLKEILDIERCSRCMNELTEFANFPLTEEKEREVKERVEEVRCVYQGLKEELDPLERLVREVFGRIVRIRREGLDKIKMN